MNTQTGVEDRNKGRLKLVLVALVFLGPLVLSFTLYYLGDWRPQGSTQNGELLPPVPLSDAPLLAAGEGPRLRGKWTMIYADEGSCAEACQKTLYETRQIRRSLGKEMSRVQRVFVVTTGAPDAEFLASEHPMLVVAATDTTARQDLLNAIGKFQPGDIFLVDPIGNLMMRFPQGTEMKAIKEDLVHLLKVSRIG